MKHRKPRRMSSRGPGFGLIVASLIGSPIPAVTTGVRAAVEGPPRTSPAVGDCVVLLHGLGRTHRSMDGMAEALRAAGYATVNIDYPSREGPIEDLAPRAVGAGIADCERLDARRIHFVTHSMGGILVRFHLAQHGPPRLGRVVMLAPPNQGSEVADALRQEPWYAWYNGPAGQQLGTGQGSVPQGLGPVDFPLGVITGDRVAFFDQWLADQIPGPNDGKVSVARARVQGMRDFLVLPYAHSFIMREPEVIEQTVQFLGHREFGRQARQAGAAPDHAASSPADG